MAVTGFNDFIDLLAQTDFFSSIIPFVLSFIVFYLALKKAPLFRDNERSSLVVSLASAFVFANFAIANPAYVTFYQNFLAGVTITVLLVAGFLVALAYVGLDVPEEFGRGDNGFIGSASVLILGIIGAAVVLSGIDAFGLPGLGLPNLSLGPVTEILFEDGGVYVLVIAGLAYLLLSEDGADGDTGTGGGGGNGEDDENEDNE